MVVSQPDRKRGRGRKTSPSPVARAAHGAALPLLQPEKLGSQGCVEALRARTPDVGVVVAFGQFIPRQVRELPSRGFLINAHASLLPRHRGAAPLAHAILAGDTVTGISVMRVEREMDAGPVLLMRETPLGDTETAGELALRLADLAADSVALALDQIASEPVHWRPQEAARATFAPKIGPEDARLDWREDAKSLVRRIRAMAPVPGAFTTVGRDRLRILAAHDEVTNPVPGSPAPRPGTAMTLGTAGLRIATGAGWLVPEVVQRAGGRAMSIDAYLRGRPIEDRSVLGDAPGSGEEAGE